LSAANLAAGLGQGFPVSGGMSQSLVNEGGGARTPLSGLIAALVVLLVAVFLSGTLRDLPQPVLAAIVLVAVAGLIQVEVLKQLWRFDRREFAIAAIVVLAVLASGILRGVLIGAVISLVLLLRRAARPHVAFLGRIAGLQRFSDLARHPDNEPVPGALLFRTEAALVYFNVDHVKEQVLARLRAAPAPVQLVVCDLSTSPYVDLAGAELLTGLHDELSKANIRFEVVEAHAKVRDMLRLEGLEEKLGRISRRRSLAEVVAEFTGRS
jgi:MFS superfamily sulfate permease-like transporter